MPKNGKSQKTKDDWLSEALNHYAREHYEETLVACEQALVLDSKYARAHHGKGLALMKMGRYEEAVTSLDRTIQLISNHWSSFYHAKVLAAKGKALYALKQYDNAFSAYQKAAILVPVDKRIQAEKDSLLFQLPNLKYQARQEAQEAQRLAAEKKAKDDAGWLCKEPFRYE